MPASAAGAVSVFAGAFGMSGTTDGTGAAARFQSSVCLTNCSRRYGALTIDANDNLYVADRGPNTSQPRPPDAIRKITPAGVVTTLASGSVVSTSGARDQFDSVAVDSVNGDVYFNASDGVRRLRSGAVTLVVAQQGNLSIAVDGVRRKLYLALQNTGLGASAPSLFRYDLSGAMPVLETTLPGGTTPVLRLAEPAASAGQLAVAPNGALLMTIADSSVILRVDPTFSRVDAVVGEFGVQGLELGPLPARLTAPTGVAVNPAGQLGLVMGRRGGNHRGDAVLLVTTGFTP
jgi:hypothetical protein